MGVVVYPELCNLMAEMNEEDREEFNNLMNEIFKAGKYGNKDDVYFYVTQLMNEYAFPYPEYALSEIIVFLSSIFKYACDNHPEVIQEFAEIVNNKEPES